jgi:hypothetical protein
MSVAIRHPLRGEPLPRRASLFAALRAWATAPRAPAAERRSVFHELAAADLPYRDAASPLFRIR